MNRRTVDETIVKLAGPFLLGLGLLVAIGPTVSRLQADPPGDAQCLRCHADPSLVQADPDGRIHSLFIDPGQWRLDVHHRRGLTCLDCHTDASISSHPVGGFGGADCALCHAEDCEAFVRTVHAAPAAAGPGQASGCHDCHSAHAVRPRDDPEASIAVQRLATTCSACHPDEAASARWINRLSFFRISGHKKENISLGSDLSQCIRCHFRDGAHGQPDSLAERCMTCHRKDGGLTAVFSRSVHASTVFGGGPLLAGIRGLSGLICLGLLGAAVFTLRRTIGIRRKGKDAAP